MIRTRNAVDRLPTPGAGFVWEDAGTSRPMPLLRAATDGVTAVFTTRRGGVSRSPYEELNLSLHVGDAPDHARANRGIAGSVLPGDAAWSVLRQVHGARVVAAPGSGPPPEADAQWTEDPERTLAVFSADCVPVLVVAPRRLAVAHAGWRGLVSGVVGNAVRAVGAGARLFAGPAIGPCCYEVGEDVVGPFVERFGSEVKRGERHVDLWAAAAAAAEEEGAVSVAAARLCTSCHEELFFSHRRDAGRTGRQALLARFG